MNIICFHNPNEENGYLSNWYLAHFTVDGNRIFLQWNEFMIVPESMPAFMMLQ